MHDGKSEDLILTANTGSVLQENIDVKNRMDVIIENENIIQLFVKPYKGQMKSISEQQNFRRQHAQNSWKN